MTEYFDRKKLRFLGEICSSRKIFILTNRNIHILYALCARVKKYLFTHNDVILYILLGLSSKKNSSHDFDSFEKTIVFLTIVLTILIFFLPRYFLRYDSFLGDTFNDISIVLNYR